MGFGKFLVGGLCSVGAIIAAPVVLPAAGMAIAASTVTGTIGLVAGTTLAAASTATVAATAAAAGAAGVAVAGACENALDKRDEKVYERVLQADAMGRRERERAHNEEVSALKKESALKDAIIAEKDKTIKDQEKFILSDIGDGEYAKTGRECFGVSID